MISINELSIGKDEPVKILKYGRMVTCQSSTGNKYYYVITTEY